MELVDVIVTCYNKEGTIERAIKSVKGQTLADFKCIVVNDGSTDNSWDVIQSAIKDDNRFIAVNMENAGVANARNTGISYGNSQYITCLDGDDGIQPDFLQTCYDAISQDRSLGIVYTDVLLAHIDSYFTVARWTECVPEKQFQGFNQVPCCNMFRRDIFERLGGYRQRYSPRGAGAEDAEMWLRFFKNGYTAKKITNEPLFVYNAHGGITQNTDYIESNWTAWHTTNPFPSLAKSANGIAHIVNEYDTPRVSIIIPVCKNHLHFLIDALDSIEAQTYQNWEAIVVYDIPDYKNDIEFLTFDKQIQIAYPYATFVYSNGQGAGIARNIGVKNSTGEYLVFLDCDDYLQTRFLELTISAIEHYGADWVYTDLYTQAIYNRSQYQLKANELDGQNLEHYIISEKNDTVEFVYRYNCDDWSIESLYRDGVAGVTSLHRRSDFDLVKGFDNQNREDWDFHLRLAQAGKCGLRLPLPLYTYRIHTGIRREYKDIAKSNEERKTLKAKDVERIHKSYNLKELEMGCSSCRKTKINITNANESDYTVLEYTGKITGGVVKGIVTGRQYQLVNANGRFIIQKVHPQDAAEFVRKGIFKPVPKPKHDNKHLVSPTPKPVIIKEVASTQPEKQTVKKEVKERKQFDFVVNPGDYPISELKRLCNLNKLTEDDYAEAYENEAMNKARKGALSFLLEKK